MGQVVSRRPITSVARFRSQAIPFEIGGGQSDTVTGFSPSSSVSPVSIVPPMLDTHLHLHVASYRKNKRAKAGNSCVRLCVRLNVCGLTRQTGRQNILCRMVPGFLCIILVRFRFGSVVLRYFTFLTRTKDLFGCRCVVLPLAFMYAAPQ
jgi:hypothetical protein